MRRIKLPSRNVSIIISTVFVGVVGTWLAVSLHAATPTVSSEAENGTLSSKACSTSDTTASGSTAVKFSSTACGGANPLSGLPLVAWYGGPSYYNISSKAVAAGWTNNTFFPVGAWYMRANQQSDINVYKALFMNHTVKMEDQANLPLIRSNGLQAFTDETQSVGAETIGWHLTDEADMNYGAGSDQFNPGQIWPNGCTPRIDNGGACGFTAMSWWLAQFPTNDGRLYHANYGKGIFPGWQSDNDFAKFVNDYTTVVSDDIYWYTDSDVCTGAQGPTMITGTGPISQYTGLHDLTTAECRRSANYGAIIDRMIALDALDGQRQPVWSFVEVGNPFTYTRSITGPQIEGAVVSSLIHGASGITYFKHNFGGSCQTTDAFIDCPGSYTTNVTNINSRMKDLATVLNTQSYQYSFGATIDTMLKWYNGSAYIFAMGKNGSTGSKTFTLPSGLSSAANVQVLYESRTLPISSGTFNDSFAAEYSYHIYKITP
ncbi:MAG TPA: hypothetical protein VF281_02570 [Candidatus Saccharimonadales bacterium]